MIVTRTPLRISFFGGGSDYPSWYKEHGGAVLGATVDKYCWIAVRRPAQFGPKFKVVYATVESCESLEEIRHPAVRECLRYVGVDGAEVIHTSDLPARSGVGSSSAFVVGLLHGLHTLKGNRPSKGQLAEEATFIEQEVLKETVGSQDQMLTAWGGANVVEFMPDSSKAESGVWVRRCFLPEEVDQLLPYLMLFWTGVQRTASDVAASYVGDFGQYADALYELRGMVDEGQAILSGRKGGLLDFGILLDRAWRVKRCLGKAVSNGKIDEACEASRWAGAVGAKLLGAGGGGFLLLFVPSEKREAVRAALPGMIEVPFRFEYAGTQVVLEER